MICIYGNSLEHSSGGVEIFNDLLQKQLEGASIKYKEFSKVNIYKKHKLLGEIISAFKTIYQKQTSKDIIVHYSNFYEIIVIPILRIRFSHIHVICHVGKSWKHISNPIFLKMTNLILRRFARNVCILSDVQREFLSHKRLFKISTIIDQKFSTVPYSINKVSDIRYILYLGRICNEKGVFDLLKSYASLYKEMNLPILKMVGPVTSEFKKSLLEFIEKNNLNTAVKIEQPIYNNIEKISLIDKCEFGIYPSYVDAFPLTLLEFYSRGKVCICSNISEAKYFVKNNKLLVNPGSIDDIKQSIKYMLSSSKSVTYDVEEMRIMAKSYATNKIIYDLQNIGVI